jgi:hypothetical protein
MLFVNRTQVMRNNVRKDDRLKPRRFSVIDA